MRLLDEDEADDPLLSVVNLIDLFLVVIGLLMIMIVTNPPSTPSSGKMTRMENPGEPAMRMIVQDGKELTHYRANGQIGQGQGVQAGITYRLDDGRLIYVPQEEAYPRPKVPSARRPDR